MKKRLIFDLDNTLIVWEDSFVGPLKETMEEYNVDFDYKKVNEVIDDLDKYEGIISKELLLNNINNKCNLNLDISFIDTLLEKQETLGIPNKDMIEILGYLKDKYSMVVLTNYYKKVQEKRLEAAGIRSFFDEVYASDYIPQKPDPEAFKIAMGDYKVEDCIMIGDSLRTDINPALELGMNVIAVDYFNKIEDNDSYPVVRKIKDLRKYL